MTETLATFSGAHPYRPQCVVESSRRLLEILLPDTAGELAVRNAERITQTIDAGTCPRCSDPLYPDPKPDGWKPAGSRATPCRCIPVCETCANWIEPVLGPSLVTAWPTDEDDGDEQTQKEVEAAFVEQAKANCTTAVMEADGSTGEPVLISESGVVPIVQRPHPGGWLEHGYDADPDRRERAR